MISSRNLIDESTMLRIRKHEIYYQEYIEIKARFKSGCNGWKAKVLITWSRAHVKIKNYLSAYKPQKLYNYVSFFLFFNNNMTRFLCMDRMIICGYNIPRIFCFTAAGLFSYHFFYALHIDKQKYEEVYTYFLNTFYRTSRIQRSYFPSRG